MEKEVRSVNGYRIIRASVITAVLFLLLFVGAAFVGAAQIAFADSETASGTCGDNLTWVLDDQGTLTISGTGDMPSYELLSSPWCDKCNSIKSVIIEDGVTKIGKNAFADCSELSTITIPDSVTRIDSYAFYHC